MAITLSPKARKLLNERLKSGRYASPEEVLLAALASLRHQEEMGDFAPGELERLVAAGEGFSSLSSRRFSNWPEDLRRWNSEFRKRHRGPGHARLPRPPRHSLPP